MLLACFLAINTSIDAQTETAYTKVYFDKNESSLNNRAVKKLTQFIGFMDTMEVIEKVYLHGFTDSDAASDYNVKLSVDRCKTVKQFLFQHGYDSLDIVIRPHGEKKAGLDANDERKQAENRRVDVVVSYQIKSLPVDSIETVVLDTCNGDTLIDMGQGVFATLNICEYNKHKSCLKYRFYKIERCSEYKWSNFKMKLGLKNYTKCIDPYTSFEFYIQTCGDTCFTLPMKVFIPTSYYQTKTGLRNFRKAMDRRTRKVTYTQKEYMLVEVRCGGGFGCGGVRSTKCCGGYKIKLKNDLKVVKATGLNEMLLSENAMIYGEKWDSSSFYVNTQLLDSLVLLDGDSLIVIENLQLQFARQSIRRCKKCGHKWFLFMRFYKHDKTIPKHYKIKAKDIDRLQNPVYN